MRTMMLAAMVMAAPATAIAQTNVGDPGLVMPSMLSNAPLVTLPDSCPSNTGLVILAEGGRLGLTRSAHFALSKSARFAVPPGHLPATESFGGTISFEAIAAGRYRMGLTPGFWIDVVKDGKPIASVAHGHINGCKTVDFQLAAGHYRVQISGGQSSSVDVIMTGVG